MYTESLLSALCCVRALFIYYPFGAVTNSINLQMRQLRPTEGVRFAQGQWDRETAKSRM